MKRGSFQQRVFMAADAATVLDIFADFCGHRELHPLIIHVERAELEPPGIRRYHIIDQLRWGPFSFRIKYRADILSITDESIHTQAFSWPRTKLTSIVRVTAAEGGVLLHEWVELEAPNLLFTYAFEQAELSHAQMLERMRLLAESRWRERG